MYELTKTNLLNPVPPSLKLIKVLVRARTNFARDVPCHYNVQHFRFLSDTDVIIVLSSSTLLPAFLQRDGATNERCILFTASTSRGLSELFFIQPVLPHGRV